MSDKWETVTKPKSGKSSAKTNGHAGSKAAAKKLIEKAPKLEDVLPAGHLDTMYSAAFDPPPSPKKDTKKATRSPAKPAPKKASKKEEKPKLPATVEEAVKRNLRVEDLKNLVDATQQKFPDSPLLWLRDIAAYLNMKLVTDPPLKEQVLTGGPITALTANMRKIINVMLNNCDQGVKESFFETCVANTAHEASKGLCVTGWKILSQLLADNQSSLAAAHLSRYVELRNSYQNRPQVGLDILWSVGQAGKKDFNAGLKVWMEVMLPVLNLRHYTKYVVDYLAALLSLHNVTPDSRPNRPAMDISSYLTLLDNVFVVSGNINKEMAKQLRALYPTLKAVSLAGCKDPELFPALMDKLEAANMPDMVLDILETLVECLAASTAALVMWHKSYTSHLAASGQLLNYIDTNWPKYKSVLDVPVLHETIEAFQDYNSSVINDTRKEGLSQCLMACESLESKMSLPRGAWFPWKTMSFLLLIATIGIINVDVNKHGSFKGSCTGQFLSDIGCYERAVSSYQLAASLAITSKVWAGENLTKGYSLARKYAGPTLDEVSAKVQEAGDLAVKYGAIGLDHVVKYLAMGLDQVRLGLDKVGAMLPGLGDQAYVYWVTASDLAHVYWVTGCDLARQLWVAVRDGCQDLVNGRVDWDGVKTGAIEKASFVQKQLVIFAEWIKQQVNTLVK